MTVRTVEAPFFRRVQAEREPYGGDDPRSHFDLGELYGGLRAGLDRDEGTNDHSIRSTTLATGDGRGIIFVGFDGEVHASGFLPLALGNVRTESLGDIYTSNPLLTTIRSGLFIGECGRCDYRRLCGGSRARAYARSGQVLGDDPSCIRTRAARRIPLPLA
jgi:radical SAM protein with 4Fe4S-binding SPASM domain